MLERSGDQRTCIRFVHVIESAPTPLPMTGAGRYGYNFSKEQPFRNRWGQCERGRGAATVGYKKNVTIKIGGRSSATEAHKKRAAKTTN